VGYGAEPRDEHRLLTIPEKVLSEFNENLIFIELTEHRNL